MKYVESGQEVQLGRMAQTPDLVGVIFSKEWRRHLHRSG